MPGTGQGKTGLLLIQADPDGATLITHAMKRAAVRDLMEGPGGCTGQEFPKRALSPKPSSI